MPLLLHDFDSCCSERIYSSVVQLIPSPFIEMQPGQVVDKVVIPATNDGRVVVVWAPEVKGPRTGWGPTVDALIEACYSSKHPSSVDIRTLVRMIETASTRAAQASIQSKTVLDKVFCTISAICSNIYKMLAAAQMMEEISDNTARKIMNAGIQLSCCVFLALLQERQVSCQYIDIRELWCTVPIRRRIPTPRAPLFHQLRDQISSDSVASVTVVAGDIACFGDVPAKPQRDHYELCSALIARYIRAAALQVYQSIGGIFTANPAIVHTADPVHTIGIIEARHLAYSDGHILCPMALGQVLDAGIPLSVIGVNNPESQGTYITSVPNLRRDTEATDKPSVTGPSVSLIATTRGVYRLKLRWTEEVGNMQFAIGLLGSITERGISLDFVLVSDAYLSVVFTMPDEPVSLQLIHKLQEVLHCLDRRVKVELNSGLAVLKVIGPDIHQSQMIQSDMLHALERNKIQTDTILNGLTEHSICYVLREECVGAALIILHRWCSKTPQP